MAASNGPGVAPAAFPPPVDVQAEFIKRELDPEDERIDVGILIVGGGTAGLATANRLLQLLADDPELMEQLGEVPVAVIEKAKVCGGHTLSGSVMRPGPLQALYPEMSREDWRARGFAFGAVAKETVYAMTGPEKAIKIMAPPQMHHHGAEVVSVSALARFQQEQAEEGGAYVLTETSATQLLVEDGRVRGVRTGDKGRGKDGQPLSTFEPGADITAKFTVLAEGCWGHLTGAAADEFNLYDGKEPQTWELGVKEIWKVPQPLDRVIHTVGPWPAKLSPKYGHVGGAWLYPMKDAKTGDDLVSIGYVLDLEYRDATTSTHDMLQLFKTHKLVKQILKDGERVGWGAKAIPGGGWWSMPKLTMPGALLTGDAAGMVDMAALKGVHHCVASGMIAAEAIVSALKSGSDSIDDYQRQVEASSIAKELYEVRNARQFLSRGLVRGVPMMGLNLFTKGKFPWGRKHWHKQDQLQVNIGDTKNDYPQPDGSYIFDKLSSVFISGNATRDDAPNHIRVEQNVPREIAEMWHWMCPARVYELPEDAPESGNVDVIVNYTNCVQCGAITAKGGRLTPPEGGDGPLYTQT